MRYLYTSLSILFALIYMGCSIGDPVAGGDEFPNIIIAGLGEVLADDISDLSSSSASVNSVNEVPAFTVSESFEILDTARSLHLYSFKRISRNDTVIIDTVNDTLFWYAMYQHGEMTFYDTLGYLINAALYDTIEGNESIVSLRGIAYSGINKYHEYGYVDADGDNLLFDPNKAVNIADVYATYYLLTTGIVTEYIRIDAGVDNNFETEPDNQIYTMSSLTTIASDTVEYYTYVDADNDGISITNLLDSCIVDLTMLSQSDENPGNTIAAYMRIVVFPSDSLRNYIISFSSSEIDPNGKKSDAFVLNKSGSNIFYPKDTAYWIGVTHGTPFDSIALDTASYEIVLGSDPTDSTDDGVSAIYYHALYQIGDIHECYGYITSNVPIKNGQEPDAGTIDYSLVLTNNLSYVVSATFSIQYIEATITDYDQSRYYCKWDRQTGKVLEYKKLN